MVWVLGDKRSYLPYLPNSPPSPRERGQSGCSGSALLVRQSQGMALAAAHLADPRQFPPSHLAPISPHHLPHPLPDQCRPVLARSGQPSARGLFKSGSVTASPATAIVALGAPLSVGGGGSGGMAETDKPEVPGVAGDDTPRQQLSPPEQLEESGQEQLQPQQELEKQQPPPHGGSSNGVKMENDDSVKEEKSDLKEKSTGNKKANRFHPYSKDKNSGTGEKKGPNRNRVFISNIPYDMKWQAIKDLMREKVGEVTYVELFKDSEGKSRVSGVVEFKDEEFVKKALETMNKYDLSGRPLNIKEDPDGENARRALQRTGGSFPGGHVPDMGSGLMNLPPSILNNPNIPPEVISNLQAGRLGSTIFVANLDFKVGWKKLKEVFSIAGTVKRADIKEDKDGKSRGMGTVTFDQAIEAVQAISMFNGQFLFDRPMHVKMDDKSVPHEDYRSHDSKTPQLPRGLGGIGMGLGPGGQPISANQLSMGGGMGNIGPGRVGFGGMETMNNMGGFGGISRMGGMGAIDDFRGSMGSGMSGGIGTGMAGMGTGMGGLGSSMGELYRGGMTSSMERDFGRGDIGMNRGFGDSFGRIGGAMIGGFAGGMGASNMGPVGSGMSHVMFAEIKMENGKSKGCGTVRFDSPESAEKACRIMNGIKISGREIDVRLDRNA
uniref:Myelin expression factor 2 n=1 Tax=Monodelphis domestica TaxID=13616 RepID=A0A5F8GIM6_MONDO